MCCSSKTDRASPTFGEDSRWARAIPIVHWPKPATRPQWLTPEQYDDAADAITLREVKVAHQVLVTTRLDHRRVSKDDLSVLCGRRWNVELDLRNLKTSTGMDILSCQTPQMNEKQLWVH